MKAGFIIFIGIKSMSKKTILVIGASSFVGSNIVENLKNDFHVIGTYCNNPVQFKNVTTLKCDVMDKNQIQTVMYAFQPQITIYCAGLNTLENCKSYPKLADALNTAGVFNVSIFTERLASKLIYISSHHVFPGDDITYTESDSPLPISIYGNTVAASEFFVQKSCLNYLILRTCFLYGKNYLPNQKNWFEYVEERILSKKKIIADNSIFQGFLDVNLFCQVLKILIEKEVTNRLMQISSSNVVTYYDFAKTYAKIFEVDDSPISKGVWTFPMEKNFFTINNSMDARTFRMEVLNIERSIGMLMPTVEQSLMATKKSLTNSDLRKRRKIEGIRYV
jgi:dTDP-4-dehydrorhamnose reductase